LVSSLSTNFFTAEFGPSDFSPTGGPGPFASPKRDFGYPRWGGGVAAWIRHRPVSSPKSGLRSPTQSGAGPSKEGMVPGDAKIGVKKMKDLTNPRSVQEDHRPLKKTWTIVGVAHIALHMCDPLETKYNIFRL